jgi:2-dehydro-3-deoxyphosphogluconate aldolase / (4S)-4-hydroxy-2-oxoglutarate aldolase
MSGRELPVLRRIAQLGVLPVVELGRSDQAQALADALHAGGIDTVEIALRTPAALAAIAELRSLRPHAFVGAGTVRSVDDARQALDAGAQFVVSPVLNLAVVELCRSARIPIVPGVCTPTELDTAVRAGIELIKFFPAEAMGGVTFLKALTGPFPDARFVPTGGVNPENLVDYLQLPQVVACGGSWMVDRGLIANGRFDLVEQLARKALAIVREVRGGE